MQTFCLDQIDPFQRRPSLGPETGQKAWPICYSFGLEYVADVDSTQGACPPLAGAHLFPLGPVEFNISNLLDQ